MGQLDTILKHYLSQSQFFADAFNYYIYGGRQVISPESLTELDTTEIALPYGMDEVSQPVQKFRDVLKSVCVGMEDQKAAYLILGIENQANVHYATPVRNMLYDAMQYVGQVTKATGSYRKAKKKGSESSLTKEEFLSGFRKTDRLIPVITLVIYFGASEWDGPLSVTDMLQPVDPELKPFIADYKMNLIAPNRMTDEEFQKFQTDLGAVLMCVKHSEDSSMAVLSRPEYNSIDQDSAMVIRAITDMKFEIDEFKDKEGKINMCKAYQNDRAEAKAEGRLEGRAEGALKKSMETAERLKGKGFSVAEIAEIVGYSESEVAEWFQA